MSEFNPDIRCIACGRNEADLKEEFSPLSIGTICLVDRTEYDIAFGQAGPEFDTEAWLIARRAFNGYGMGIVTTDPIVGEG